MLADVYSTVYWLAARHRWMDMAELAVTRQRWAVEQQPNPVAEAFSSRDRAGTYLNFGDVERGLVVVDRAIVAVQSAPLSTADRDLAVVILNLRGMTLAGRLRDKTEGKREARRHIESAWRAAGSFPTRDVDAQGLTFGPQNTFTHVLAAQVDLGRPQDALALTDDLDEALEGLPPTRVAPTRINAARAQLDLGDRDGALENLSRAFDVAPQMARIHPMGREVLRVLVSLHRRTKPELKRLSRLSGIRLGNRETCSRSRAGLGGFIAGRQTASVARRSTTSSSWRHAFGSGTGRCLPGSPPRAGGPGVRAARREEEGAASLGGQERYRGGRVVPRTALTC
ncbi:MULTISPECIES: DNA-binding protein [unclassified Streptomyces]|uniref:DNA-binding protein n=1 Tax=unclassified Streptomyces TaxID=2593676 RepID=UPI000FB7AA4A|nr:DNA-binding protein [Streptomyces sp. ADI95-17]RPK62185.1 hypothetical protein EES42_31005 [Streptomyces sp. ADI95-17]WSW99156.1 DNA-binding protein [Streptomyces sp. NBC_00987]